MRTEKVHISESPVEGYVSCKGKVVNNEFLGATTKTRIEIGNGTVITAMSFDSKTIQKGSEVYATFSAEDVLILN